MSFCTFLYVAHFCCTILSRMLVIKARIKGETVWRRFRLTKPTYKALQESLTRTFGNISTSIRSICYYDKEGDTCIISQDEELQAALECFRKPTSGGDLEEVVLKLEVILNEESKKMDSSSLSSSVVEEKTTATATAATATTPDTDPEINPDKFQVSVLWEATYTGHTIRKVHHLPKGVKKSSVNADGSFARDDTLNSLLSQHPHTFPIMVSATLEIRPAGWI